MPDNYVTPVTAAPSSPVPATLTDPGAATAPTVTAAGFRADAVPAAINITLLRQAVVTPTVLPASGSTGASMILRELLLESGVAFSIEREVFNDNSSHQAGNAVDVNADDLTAVADFCIAVPGLFEHVAWENDDFPSEYAFIQGGAISGSRFTIDNTTTRLHMDTTLTRLRGALNNRIIVAVLLAGSWTGQFGNRDVFAVPADTVASSLGAAVDTRGVRFW